MDRMLSEHMVTAQFLQKHFGDNRSSIVHNVTESTTQIHP